jgi:hypothetical protein
MQTLTLELPKQMAEELAVADDEFIIQALQAGLEKARQSSESATEPPYVTRVSGGRGERPIIRGTGTALLTSDASDFISIAQRWYADKREHAGVTIAPVFGRRQMGTLLRLTLQLLDRLTAEELCNAVVYLQQFE